MDRYNFLCRASCLELSISSCLSWVRWVHLKTASFLCEGVTILRMLGLFLLICLAWATLFSFMSWLLCRELNGIYNILIRLVWLYGVIWTVSLIYPGLFCLWYLCCLGLFALGLLDWVVSRVEFLVRCFFYFELKRLSIWCVYLKDVLQNFLMKSRKRNIKT